MFFSFFKYLFAKTEIEKHISITFKEKVFFFRMPWQTIKICPVLAILRVYRSNIVPYIGVHWDDLYSFSVPASSWYVKHCWNIFFPFLSKIRLSCNTLVSMLLIENFPGTILFSFHLIQMRVKFQLCKGNILCMYVPRFLVPLRWTTNFSKLLGADCKL